MSSSEQGLHSSTASYELSERDGDVGKVLIRSFRIPNPRDAGSMNRKEDEERMHPAKALFALVMHAYIVGPEGRTITPEELEFLS